MIKRTTMHLRLKQDESVSTQGSGISGLMQGCKDYSFQVENAKRREEKYFSKIRNLGIIIIILIIRGSNISHECQSYIWSFGENIH